MGKPKNNHKPERQQLRFSKEAKKGVSTEWHLLNTNL
jgi:hypothetical protein